MSGIVVTPTGRDYANSYWTQSLASRFGQRTPGLDMSGVRMSAEGRQSSLRSWSVDNGERPGSLAHASEYEDEFETIEHLSGEEEVPYVSAPINFVRILYGASQILLVNTDCRRKIFMNYLQKKLGSRNRITGAEVLDLCSKEGALLNLEIVDDNENIDYLFQHGEMYIPCIVTRTDAGYLESIKPCLKRWERLYPLMEDVFNKVIEAEQEEARKRERSLAATVASLHSEEKKEKEKEKDSDVKQEKKKKGKV